jgi:hypothetical protein
MYRSTVVVALVVACGGGVRETKETAVADKPPPAAPGPPATRDALVAATLAAISAGDVDALARLADVDAIAARALACGTHEDNHAEIAKTRERIGELIARAKEGGGVRVELEGVDRDKRTRVVEVGNEAGGHCTAKVRLVFHDLKLDINVTTANGIKPSHAKLLVLEAGGAWFLAMAPRLDAPGSMSSMMDKMREFTDKVCACKDKACVDGVSDEMMRWAQDNAGKSDEAPSDEDMKLGAQLGEQMAKCMQAAMGVTP